MPLTTTFWKTIKVQAFSLWMEHLLIYNTTDSTNKEAQRLLSAGRAFHGMTLLALEQTEGKGQYGRIWRAEKGKHLAMSIILRPKQMSVRDLPGISMLTSLGLGRAISKLEGISGIAIKWPNDLYLHDRKLAGILIENALAGQYVQHLILGIGVNVNETSFSPDLPNPVSLFQATGREHDLTELAGQIRHHVLDAIEHPEADWLDQYNELLFGLRRPSAFDHQGHTIIGEILAADQEGRLNIRGEDGKRYAYYSHEIKWKTS